MSSSSDEVTEIPDPEGLFDRFTYHAPRGDDDVAAFMRIRNAGLTMAQQVVADVPRSPERSLALRKIEESVMWANAARARHPQE